MIDYTINPHLMEMPFEEIKSLGADRIADIDHIDLLISLRHTYLQSAKDLICNPDRAYGDYVFGQFICEMAEAMQSVIDVYLEIQPP
jgi:hypothetical protein